MRAARVQVCTNIRHHLGIFFSIDRRRVERSGTAPIFMRRIRVHDFRHELRLHVVCEKTVTPSGFGVQLLDVGEGKDIDRIEEARERTSRSRGQRKPIVKTSTASAGDVRHHAIEYLPMRFILIETVVEIRTEKSAAL